MNFFAQQDRARSTTRKLVVLFVLAIAVLILVTTFLVVALLFMAEGDINNPGLNAEFLSSDIFLMVGAGVITVVALGSAYRFIQLRGGGKAVAESMGGRLLNINVRNADERKILNVVEEMAIAAGLPVPPVYLIEDEGINAFAAGYHQTDAVIGVTRGCIQILSREELQGVIAHEFSHIFNGDMRLNIRLMGLLYGIMVLGMIGYFIMRSSMYSRSSRSKKGGGIIFLGLGLVVIGYGGTFFGNMIKAAVSRQREFLADASAVQFTRNPGGISGALKKIGGYAPGARINSVDASEISHMLFGEGLSAGFTGLFATHPPLKERILKIEPSWRGQFPKVSLSKIGSASEQVSSFGESIEVQSSAVNISSIDSIGEPRAVHLAVAIEQLKKIPDSIKAEAHTSFGASALMYALLIEFSGLEATDKKLALLQEGLSVENYQELLLIITRVRGLPRELYLPLVDIALPSLKQLSPHQYRTFMSHLSHLVVLDNKIEMFEWSLFKVLRYNLDTVPKRRGMRLDLKQVGAECEVLFSILVASGNQNKTAAENSFKVAKECLNLSEEIKYLEITTADTAALEESISVLQKLKPLQKPLLLKAMVKCINADGKVTPEEAELLRALGSLLDCPIPALLPGQSFL